MCHNRLEQFQVFDTGTICKCGVDGLELRAARCHGQKFFGLDELSFISLWACRRASWNARLASKDRRLNP